MFHIFRFVKRFDAMLYALYKSGLSLLLLLFILGKNKFLKWFFERDKGNGNS